MSRLRIFLLVSLALVFTPMHAASAMDLVKSGQVPRLKENEGLLLVAVDTDISLVSVRIRREDRVFGSGATIRQLPEGPSHRLYVVPAGTYRWADLRPIWGFRFDFRTNDEFKFTVQPGELTYAGVLVFRANGPFNSAFNLSNRGLAAMDWLRSEHPQASRAYRFVYSGHYPDPFPEFIAELEAGANGVLPAPQELGAPPAPGELPLPVRKLWQEDRVVSARMNPAGTLVAVQVRHSDTHWEVDLVDLESNKFGTIARSEVAFGTPVWSGDNNILLPIGSSDDARKIMLLKVGPPVEGGFRSTQRLDLPRKGWIVDTVPDDPDRIIFASIASNSGLAIHEIDIGSQKALDSFRYPIRERMNIGVERDVAWFTDGNARLRLVVARRTRPSADPEGGDEEKRVLLHGADGRYAEVMEIDSDEPFIPVGVSADGESIYGITEKDRNQKELVVFDPASRSIVRTLFSREGVDVSDVIRDRRGDAIGVTYYQSGRLVSEYFDEATNRQAEVLRRTFPGMSVAVSARSMDGNRLLLWVDAGDQPAQLFQLDLGRREASLVDETMPWINASDLAPSEAFTFTAPDGTQLEAFLTMPRREGKRPMIVFPHGGPIGVKDTLHFDPEVQFLASLGYAVLRVNFRGSEGYGRAFREAGHRQHGTAIEDDIDAAIRHVLAAYPVDASRMCAVGTSYGGYSSLVSAIRWPDRFRCAVSIAGVSDRILFFTASDSGRNPSVRKLMEERIGDPREQLEEMKRSSPLYYFRDLKIPVMLVHGKEDVRVDYEHARRLQRMLVMDGRPPVGLVFEKEGHGVTDIDNIEAMWNGIAGFLRQHLGDGD